MGIANENLTRPDLNAVANVYNPDNHTGVDHQVLQKRCHSKVYHNTKSFYLKRFPDYNIDVLKELCQQAGVKATTKWRELYSIEQP
jgi:hypothetical protein